jgi:hypothetical protein
MMRSRLALLLLCFAMTASAETMTVKNSITIELADKAVNSNLLYISPLRVGACQDFAVIERHQQSSVVDKKVSRVDVTARKCDPEFYFIEYTYYLVRNLPEKGFCSFQVKIRSDSSQAIPQPQIIGDCGFRVSSQQVSATEFHYVITSEQSPQSSNA